MDAGAGLEDGVFRTGAGPDPGMSTSAPFLCREIVNRGPSAFHGNLPLASLLTLATSVPTLLALQGLQTLSVKVWIIDILF